MTMAAWRVAWAGAVVAAGLAASPANAQFFLQSRDLRGAPVTGLEKGVGEVLPDATAAEQRAALVWNMRAALNVAALQCQFEPTLLTVDNYNAVLRNHSVELKGAFDTLGKYFKRTTKTPKAGQTALDQFGTRTYSGFATVAAQLGFCQTASAIGRDAKFTPRGALGDMVMQRTRELRNSLVPFGEQRFAYRIGYDQASLPRLDPICWDKKVRWVRKKCGDFAWPPTRATAAAAVAAR
jgi:hypothetical protein